MYSALTLLQSSLMCYWLHVGSRFIGVVARLLIEYVLQNPYVSVNDLCSRQLP